MVQSIMSVTNINARHFDTEKIKFSYIDLKRLVT